MSEIDHITETVKEFLSKTGSDTPTERRKSPDVDGELVQWNEIIDYVKEYYDSDNDLCSASENAYANGGMNFPTNFFYSFCSFAELGFMWKKFFRFSPYEFFFCH